MSVNCRQRPFAAGSDRVAACVAMATIPFDNATPPTYTSRVNLRVRCIPLVVKKTSHPSLEQKKLGAIFIHVDAVQFY